MIVVYSAALERERVRSQQRAPDRGARNTLKATSRTIVWQIMTADPARWWSSAELSKAMNCQASRVRVSEVTAKLYAEGRLLRRSDMRCKWYGRIWRYRVK